MTTLRATGTTTAPASAVVAALTDFGPDRPSIFPTSDPSFFRLHEQGGDWADVTEGNTQGGGNWERLRYDWSRPGTVTARTLESNLWGGDSGHTWTITDRPGGGSQVDLVTVRTPKGGRGRAVALLLRVIGPRFVRRVHETMLRAVEARAGGAPTS